ncbi:MAG: BTAD domain-containing putative transcriptional regulator [Allosphingosinicella sp.]|uniref:BTAD domain-containing putative transcriptional regulator n=1 Tax=Allosphingosinicella sp. TaxID=2823234 RepID=UPI00394F5329
MNPWKLKLLGDCALLSPSGHTTRLSTRKSLALMAYLAMQPDRRARRQRISDLLWEDADAEQGRLHVRKALWLVRSESAKTEADGPAPVAGDGEFLAIPDGMVATDVDEFVAAAEGAGDDPELLEAAAALYAGDFLGGFAIRNASAFEDWAEFERQRLRETAVSVLRRLLDAYSSRPDSSEPAMRAALRLLILDPLEENAHRTVMRAHARQGRAAAALTHYHGFRETLARELGVDPEPQTQALFREISAGRRSGEKAAPSPAPVPAPAPASAEIPLVAATVEDATVVPPAPAPAPAAPRRSRWRLAAEIAALAAAGIAAGGYNWFSTANAAPAIDRVFPIANGLVVTGRPALSPDGSRVAFTARAPDSPNVDLYLFTIGDSAPVRLTQDEAVDDNAAWSPDGTRIAFTRAAPDGSVPCRLFVMTVPAGTERPVGACRAVSSTRLAWTHDGDELLYSDRAAPEAPLAIRRLALDSGRTSAVTEPSSDLFGDLEPVLSSDGRWLAFLRLSSRQSADIFLLDMESGAITPLTTDGKAIGGVAWSAGDSGILFSSDRAGDAGLWWVSRRGGEPQRISEGLLRYGNLSQARSRRRIVFEGIRDRSSLHELQPGAEPAILAGEAEFRDWFPDVARDGTLLFVSTRTGSEQIWMRDPGGAPRQATQLDGWRIVQPRWSRDGRHVAFVAVVNDVADLYVMPRSGGQPRRVTRDAAEDGSPDWSPDGRYLYFTSRREGGPAVWRIDPFADRAEAVRVTEPGIAHFRIGRAGAWLYHVQSGQTGLWRRALARGGAAVTGPTQKVVDGLAVADWTNWDLSDDSVFYVERPDGVRRGARLKRMDIGSGAVTDLADASLLNRSAGFALTPDGRPVLNLQSFKIELYGMDFR